VKSFIGHPARDIRGAAPTNWHQDVDRKVASPRNPFCQSVGIPLNGEHIREWRSV